MNEIKSAIELGMRIIAKSVYDVEECAAFLGVSESRVRHLIAQKALPYYKVGNAIRFNKNDLEKELIKGVRIASESEIQKKAISYGKH